MIDPLIVKAPLNDRKFDYNHQELSTLQLLAKIVPKLNETIDLSNTVDNKIAGKEDSDNISKNRKLSSKGNFTGLVNGRSANLVITGIDSNKDKINYLASQFSDGQTGLIIDGGFFEDSNIKKNYDGGIF